MESRRRSARLQAIHNATSNEEADAIVKPTDSKANVRKRSSLENGDGPPQARRRRSSAIMTQKKTVNKTPNENPPSPEDTHDNLQELDHISPDEGQQKENQQDTLSIQKSDADPLQEIETNNAPDINGVHSDRSSSMETFGVDSDGEAPQNQPKKLPPKPPLTNRPRRSNVVVSYKEPANESIDSTDSDLSDNETDSFDDHEGSDEMKTQRTQKMVKRKHEESMEENSSAEEDDELYESSVKKKTQRRSAVGSGRKKGPSKGNTTSKRMFDRSSFVQGIKTPVNKGIKPWEKQSGNIIKHKTGDIIVPDRPLRRGEQKMLVFRILATQLAMERREEIDLNEGYRLLDQIKAEYNQDKAGYIKRILMTGGRDPDEELEPKEEASQDNNQECSSSEDEWMEMEPVESDKKNKLEVVLEDKEASGYDWWAVYLRQEVNKKIRQKYENTHKVHLLCYLAHLQQIVKVILHEKTVPYLLLSQLPEKLAAFKDEILTKEKIHQLAMWFKSNYKPSMEQISLGVNNGLNQEMDHYATLVGEKCYETDLERSALLFALLDGLGAISRICVNTRPIPRRWTEDRKPTTSKSKKAAENKDKKGKETTNSQTKKTKREEMDYWVEYWNTQENRWICINPGNGKVDDPDEIEQATHSPIYYVFAVDNKRGIRDVSARYASGFSRPEFRRRRTEGSWLTRTLTCEVVKANEQRAKLEDLHFKTEMTNRPLPLYVNEYKNHPLYVLERDLLKFQALYPPASEQKPLGKIREHNVYPRSTVHTLLGEKKWEKLARSIKEGEKPYKIVKAFPNFRIPKEERTDALLNVYGYWQTEPFRPPKVENGIIPRNEYGNVYMYQPSMCPIGAVHLRLPGLVQIARRLGKECVPAITGWDFNHCGNWPIVDGACVLEEDKDIFIAEWRQAEADREAREKKKIEERALKNWKKFIQGALRLHRVKTRFGHPVEEQSKKAGKPKKEEPTPEPTASIIDNTEQPVVKEYNLHDVMGI